VTKTFGSGETAVHALVSADLVVNEGEVLLIEGPSGSGKTTLLSILGLLLRPTSGQVLVDGESAADLPESAYPDLRAQVFGFIFQGFNLFPALSALENVELAMHVRRPGSKNGRAESKRLLTEVGLGHRLAHLPADLSGGEKQRVAIARALCGGPRVILGDEPTAALDTKTGLGVVELLRRASHDGGRAVVIVTHDPRLERFADRVVYVEDGRVRLPDTLPGAAPASSIHERIPEGL
jgi:putative ABC transport system ATP-binding protein